MQISDHCLEAFEALAHVLDQRCGFVGVHQRNLALALPKLGSC
jgi:hypothetical protein